MLFKASYFGSNSGDWEQRRYPEQTRTVEPVTSSVPTAVSQNQQPPRWQQSRRYLSQAYAEDAASVAYYPSDARQETMEDRHYHYPSRAQQYYPHHCRWSDYHHQKQHKLSQANKVAELISNRNFEGQMMPSNDSSTAYSLLFGAGTFLALTGLASFTGIRPRLSGMMGHKVAHFTLTAAAGVAAGSVSLRYQVQHQTLNDLKKVGTYMTPSEPSPSADALAQHPIVVQALMERQREQQNNQSDPWQNAVRRWETRPDFSFSRRGTKREIIRELDHVLDHFEERRALLLQTGLKEEEAEEQGSKNQPEPARETPRGRRRAWSK